MARAMKGNQSAVAGGVSAGTASNAAPGRPSLGQSGLGASGGQRLPVAPRERKPALAALAVLLILGGALASAYLVMASGQRVSAIRIVQPVAAGQPIPLTALQEVQVGDTGVDYYIRWSERAKVARTYAAVPLVRGALLTNGMVSKTPAAERGRVVVGLALKPGQLPTAKGLVSGARVSLYAVGTGAGSSGPRPGTVLSTNAIVVTIGAAGKGDRLRGDQTSVDVAVPPNEVAAIAQAASAGAVAIALLPPGTEPAPQQPANPGPEKQQTPNNGNGNGTQNPGPGNGTGNGAGNGNGSGTGNNNSTGPGGN
ncbi:hypothetical protein ACGFNU_25495 [Spirillospora sp. NPDC048911]|uniref:hypothetical protein n=1 Tax=Spirillospora sp. NPDC048911 TaxID=3364527 RepID=UPI00371BF00D